MSSTLTINSNLPSLDAQRRLGESTAALQQSFQRLSSGLRINKASDDAAGLAIASSLNTDSRVYTVGIRNVNDATSFFSIAEGALNSLVDITTRLKELAQQSSNGVLSFTQRKSLDAEAQALGKEYQRIINTTQFNGQNIINSGNGPLSVQLGYSALSLSGGNAPTGSFAAAQTYATGGGSLPFYVTAADVNGDGIIDLVSADGGNNRLGVFIGNGDGTFQAGRTYATGNLPISVTTADVNGDGNVDLVSADFNSHQLSVFIGNGNGTFQAGRTYATGISTSSVITADVNGDGITDLVSADLASNQLSVFIGNGNGTFQVARTYATGLQPTSVTTADVNGDGIADLISADNADNQLSVFIGNGNGTFQAGRTFATGLQPQTVTTADINGDGIADLISTDHGSSQLSVFIGNGNGTFQVARTYAARNSPYSVTMADINGDGIADLISTDNSSNQLSAFIGNGNGTFLAGQTYATSSNSFSVTTADVNGDGIADLVSADTSSNQLSVFIGNGAAQAVVAPTTGTYSLLSRQSSLQALTQFTKVLNSLTASIGAVGANESRLQIATSVLQETRINYQSAASQIQDVDVASEAANLAKGNILQQAGAAILAQANQQPALALTLLRNI